MSDSDDVTQEPQEASGNPVLATEPAIFTATISVKRASGSTDVYALTGYVVKDETPCQ